MSGNAACPNAVPRSGSSRPDDPINQAMMRSQQPLEKSHDAQEDAGMHPQKDTNA
jgi:hypothetical protein